MILYILSIFLSAFLLFQVQPLIARYILPWFGGTPAVWSTVQLFFQVFLTGGYAYASWLVGRVPLKKQAWIHIALLALSLGIVVWLGFLWPSPITPDSSWKPTEVDTPISDIFKLLLVSVAVPYFLLATNSPLTQAWFNRALPGRSPYWLYALSNIGSLLGLLAYPFLIEPNLPVRMQGWAWSGGYALFVLLAGYGAFRASRRTAPLEPAPAIAEASPPTTRPSPQTQLLWILLSATASTIYLGATSQISQEVATIPFLWVLPFSIYLLSFILTYSDERWYNRTVFGLLAPVAAVAFFWAALDKLIPFIPLIAIYCFILFVGVMICNGETYRLRPAPAHLTRFYLLTSVGGALGGIAVNLVAPYIFNGYWEFPIGFGVVCMLVLSFLVTRKSTNHALRMTFIRNVLVGTMVLLTGVAALFTLTGGKTPGALFEKRNFYGVVRVKESDAGDPQWHAYALVHGVTLHGLQYTAPDKRYLPTTYYVEQSGVGLAILHHPRRGHGMRVGVLGLGIGTLAAYGQPGDTYRFYEINPLVIQLAEGQGGYFSFLADSAAHTTVVPGDARISLERELAAGQHPSFDILALDVFSSDSIPVHLVTKEAFAVYMAALSPDGILAAHVSNRYLDLMPVFWQLGKAYHLSMAVIPSAGDGRRAATSSWILLAPNPALLQIPAIAQHALPTQNYTTRIPLWTDDFSNLFQILH